MINGAKSRFSVILKVVIRQLFHFQCDFNSIHQTTLYNDFNVIFLPLVRRVIGSLSHFQIYLVSLQGRNRRNSSVCTQSRIWSTDESHRGLVPCLFFQAPPRCVQHYYPACQDDCRPNHDRSDDGILFSFWFRLCCWWWWWWGSCKWWWWGSCKWWLWGSSKWWLWGSRGGWNLFRVLFIVSSVPGTTVIVPLSHVRIA